MIAKRIACCVVWMGLVSSLGLAAHATPASAPAAPASTPGPELTAKFDAAAAYGVPGVVLPPGSFSIEVVSHLGKRYIVHVEDQAGDVLATFLGLPSGAVGHPADGRVSWPKSSQGVSYLRGWYFAQGGVGLEFVYPKTEAVAIAQANHAEVAAIDPASDGLLTATPKDLSPKDLSPKDLQVVTLWMLTPTKVGATGADGIEAKKYDQVASLGHKPALKALPHTASGLGWFYLVGVLSCAGAFGLRVRRVA